MEDDNEETTLIRKLAVTWHLNVPERRKLPGGRAKASLLLAAIEDELRRAGRYPPGATPDDDFAGGLIELTPQGACRTYWKTQVSFSQFEMSSIVEHESPRAAAATLLHALFPADIDGIPIDWQA